MFSTGLSRGPAQPHVRVNDAFPGIRPIPQAAPPQERPTLETNGIIRTTVFPNNIRKLRMAVPADANLQTFCAVKTLNYTRVAKIERGEVFPKAAELTVLALALDTSVDSLIIDVTAEDFDYEAWARENIEASLSHRGGDFDAMVLGAYLRYTRDKQDLSIPQISRITGIPAATLSRVENALFPLDRIAANVRKALADHYVKENPVDRFQWLLGQSSQALRSGVLDEMLNTLFGKLTLEHIKQRQMIELFQELGTPKLLALADKMQRLLQMVARTAPLPPPQTDEQMIAEAIAKTNRELMDAMVSFENQMTRWLPKNRHCSLVLTHLETAKLFLREHLAAQPA